MVFFMNFAPVIKIMSENIESFWGILKKIRLVKYFIITY